MITPLLLTDLQKVYGGNLVACSDGQAICSVSTNTRDIAMGDTFVALKGERFDAHDFIASAIDNGASALVVDHEIDGVELAQWVVADTTLALGHISHAQREQFTGKLVAITGSSGKTTVKGMVHSILQAAVGDKVFATQGNLNNHIGVPQSLLSINASHDYAVIEMGASGMGEIDYLTHIAKPHVAMVNNVMAAHVEGFGSIDNIAIAKGEIYDGLGDDGIAIVNLDDHYCEQWLSSNQNRQTLGYSVSSSRSSASDIQAIDISQKKDGCFRFTLVIKGQQLAVSLQVLGVHNVANAVAAASCAYALGIDLDDITKGLEGFSGVPGRLQCLKGVKGSTVIDDSYNANPSSVCAAIDVLANVPAKKILILGDMAELGDEAVQAHQDVGLYGRDKNIDYLLSIGTYTKAASDRFSVNNFHFNTIEQLIASANDMADDNTVFLIKGSRSSRMDRVVQALIQRGDNNVSLVS